ncbi:MAG: photosynthetic complex assembly protein PuhC [Pseudomonadota bacterium]
MSQQDLIERDREMIPNVLLKGLLAVVMLCLAIAIYASVTGRPLEATPPPLDIVKERQIQIFATMSGSARVTDPDGSLIAELSPQEGGFVAGIGRVLERERAKLGIEGTAPIRLIQYSNGRLALRDDFTAWRAELTGFGQTNEAAFHKLLNN